MSISFHVRHLAWVVVLVLLWAWAVHAEGNDRGRPLGFLSALVQWVTFIAWFFGGLAFEAGLWAGGR